MSKSYISKNGVVHYKTTGRSNELTKKAIGLFRQGSTPSLKQKNLVNNSPNSAAAITTKTLKKAFEYK